MVLEGQTMMKNTLSGKSGKEFIHHIYHVYFGMYLKRNIVLIW